jgi:hypothetical protein
VALLAGVVLTWKQPRKLKYSLLLAAFKTKIKKLFKPFKSKDPAFAILLVGLVLMGLLLLLNVSTLTAILMAVLLMAIIGTIAYAND